MISQLHVISPRGDCIISRDFRKDSPPGTAEKFFRRLKSWDGSPPPIFTVDGVHYISVDKSGIFFVLIATGDLSPVWAVDLLNKVVKAFKDFCGVLSEESLRRNFIMVYELIDEMIDSGYPQSTASEVLKLSVHSDAIDMTSQPTLNLSNPMSIIPQLRGMTSPASTIASSANQRPIGMVSSTATSPSGSLVVGGITLPGSLKIPGLTVDPTANLKNEIFVDILEKVTAVVSASSGQIITASIDGAIQMKSYLSGNPALKLCLNEDLVIAGEDRNVQYSSSATLDDVIFHEAADLSEFDSARILNLVPPDGEFVLMNYRISNFNKLPFRVYPTVDIVSADRVEVQIAIRADIPDQNYGSNMLVSLPLPAYSIRTVSSDAVGVAPGLATSEHLATENRVVWHIKKLQGGSEVLCRARINLSQPVSHAKLFSPVSLHFEVPMYSMSNLQVRYLRINEGGRFGGSPSNGPQRWVRYVAQSQSYMFRL